MLTATIRIGATTGTTISHSLRRRAACPRPERFVLGVTARRAVGGAGWPELVGEDRFALVETPDIADALLHRAMLAGGAARRGRARRLTPASCAIAAAPEGPTLPEILAMRLHALGVVPAHAERHIGAPGQLDHRTARLGVAGEHDRSPRDHRAGTRANPGTAARASAGAAVTRHSRPMCTGTGPTYSGQHRGGLRGSVPPRFTKMRWLGDAPTRAFQSSAKAPGVAEEASR